MSKYAINEDLVFSDRFAGFCNHDYSIIMKFGH